MDIEVNDSDLLLLLATSIISGGTFWWNYLRTEAGRNFGRNAESGSFIRYLTAAAALPIMCAVILTFALQASAIGDLGRLLLLATLFQGQWLLSGRLFALALRQQNKERV